MSGDKVDSIQEAATSLDALNLSGFPPPASHHDTIVDLTVSTEAFDFDAHRRLAVEQYQPLRPIYEAFAEVVRAILTQAIVNADIGVASIEHERNRSRASERNRRQQPRKTPMPLATETLSARLQISLQRG